MVKLLKENRRKIIMLTTIVLFGVFLITKPFNNKEVKLDEVGIKEIEKNNMFAIMLSNGDGTYSESNDTKWPPKGYKYNKYLSGCVDYNGNKIEGILSYDDENHMATVESGATSQCFLYFDKITLMKALNTSTSYSTSVFGTYYNKIKNIYFVKYISENANKIKKWDLSDVDNGTEAESVIGWLEVNGSQYDLYIGADSKIYANNLSYAFVGLSVLETVDFSNLDTLETTDMSYMFYSSSSSKLTSVGDLSIFDTSKVTNMSYMFYQASGLTSLDLSGWDTSQVTDMSYMFSGASSLINLNLKDWNLGSITNVKYMFQGTSKLASLDLSSWQTLGATDFSDMFRGAKSLTSVGDLSNWNTSSVTSMYEMFYNTTVLTDLSSIARWDTSSVTNMNSMFVSAGGLKELDLSNWDVSMVTDMGSMFNSASGLTSLILKDWNTSNVTDVTKMFRNTNQLTSLDLSGWNTSGVTNMNSMFEGASSLTNLDLSGWNTLNVTNMSSMFYGCSSLEILKMNIASFKQITNSSNYQYMFGRNASGYKYTLVPETIKVTVKDSDQAKWIRSRLNEQLGSGKGTIYLADGTIYK